MAVFTFANTLTRVNFEQGFRGQSSSVDRIRRTVPVVDLKREPEQHSGTTVSTVA
jgi:hypothetical protein